MIAMFSLCVLNHTIYLKKTARCNEPGGFNSRNDLHNPKSRIVSGDSPPLCVSNLTFFLKKPLGIVSWYRAVILYM